MSAQERFFLLACFLLVASIFGQVYFMFIYDNTVYAPDQGSVINLARVVFQISGMLASVGLFIVSSLMMIALWLDKKISCIRLAAPLPPA